MAKIVPVSDLRNYGNVLDKIENDKPVYLTRNGHDAYNIRTMEDEEYFLKAEAMIYLPSEINSHLKESRKVER